MLHTRSCLLTPRQQHQLADLFSTEEHAALEVTWSAYQNIVDACRTPDTSVGKALMRAEINTRTSTRVPSCPTELLTLGRTLKRRAGDFLAYFDHPHNHGWPYRSHLRPPRTPTRLLPRIRKPHPSTPQNRRIQTPTTPPIMKSRYRLGMFLALWVSLSPPTSNYEESVTVMCPFR